MKQAAETVSAFHMAGAGEEDRVRGRTGGPLLEALVRPGPVVVADELGQHVLEVPPAKDQQVVQALAPSCPHPAFGEGVVDGAFVWEAVVRKLSRATIRATAEVLGLPLTTVRDRLSRYHERAPALGRG